MRTLLFSLQTKLVAAITGSILVAILLAGLVFVVNQRDDRRHQALERVAAASPAIYQRAYIALLTPADEEDDDHDISHELAELAADQHVRILILDTDGIVLHDTGDRLTGIQLDVPSSSIDDITRGFVSWEPDGGFPEANLTFVSASSRLVAGGRPLPFRIVLAVESDTIAEAWRSVLPGLGIAAAVAVPLAALLGILLARQVAQPVRKLTAASEAMARGDFDQRVEVDRDDEIGRLARSFTSMAERVGERDTQMRALLANVSHDLKTPMTSITGYGQSLADGTASPDDASRIGGVIRDEAEHVNRMLADLLYLGEIDAGQIVRRSENVPLVDLVERCTRRIAPTASSKHIEVTTAVERDVLLHGVDTEKIERAFTNVMDNAAKFTPEGGRISVRGWSENGVAAPQVRCSVTNSGAPISQEDLPRLFDRFYRGDRTRHTSGSGLGLSIARQLIELHGGRINAANGPEGVTFTISLPK